MINPGLGASQISAGLGVGRAAGGASFPLWSLSGDHSTQFMAALNALSATQSDTATTFGSLAGTTKWAGGVLAPNGCIYGMPRNSTTVLKIDPTTDTATTFGSLVGTTKWAGGVLAPNGCIYEMPRNSTTVLKLLSSFPVNANFPQSRYVNKF